MLVYQGVSKNVKADLFWISLALITSHGPVNGLPGGNMDPPYDSSRKTSRQHIHT